MIHLNVDKLAAMVRTKRETKGMREAAKEIGCSASTLSRVEHEHAPDITSFLLLCQWLEVTPSEFFTSEPLTVENTCVRVCMLLKQDQYLDPVAANVLVAIVESAYWQFCRPEGARRS